MKSVEAQLEQGSKWDARMLFCGILLVLIAFLSTYDTEIWDSIPYLFLPLLTIGVSLVLLNVFLRIIRPKLKVTVFEIQDEQLKICPLSNLQFSGWLADNPITVSISDISRVRAYDFYNQGNKAGMYWVCLELNNKRVYEFNFDNAQLFTEIIEFVGSELPDVELDVDPGIKP